MQVKTPPPEYLWAISGGLLASSCCVLQLVFNAFSVGCAGFAVLTPYRPAFLALTSASLAYTHYKYRDRRRTVLALALAVSLAGSPELVHWYNKHSRCWPRLLCGSTTSEQFKQHHREQVELHVEGLKCVSCAMRLKQGLLSHLSAQNGSCEVDFPSGRVVATGAALQPLHLVAVIEGRGYSAKIVRHESFGASRPQEGDGQNPEISSKHFRTSEL